jgi:hypothetical protein
LAPTDVVRNEKDMKHILTGLKIIGPFALLVAGFFPGSLFSGEFTLGLIGQIRIRSAGNGFSSAFRSPSSVSPNHFA